MTTIGVFAIILAIIGLIGSIAPGIPGPPLNWLALLLVYFDKAAEPMTSTFLLVWLGITTLVTLLDFIFPALFTKISGAHKEASTGAVIGMLAGIFLTPVGMIAGSLLGAFIGEYFFADRGVWASFKASIGAFMAFVISTGIKITVSGIMFYYTLTYLL